jgi:hypothetical protein
MSLPHLPPQRTHLPKPYPTRPRQRTPGPSLAKGQELPGTAHTCRQPHGIGLVRLFDIGQACGFRGPRMEGKGTAIVYAGMAGAFISQGSMRQSTWEGYPPPRKTCFCFVPLQNIAAPAVPLLADNPDKSTAVGQVPSCYSRRRQMFGPGGGHGQTGYLERWGLCGG